jgi:hypothetical protein
MALRWFLSETLRFFTGVYREALQSEMRQVFFNLWQTRRFSRGEECVANPSTQAL